MADITIIRGKTWTQVRRWLQETLVFKAITGISKTGGSPVLTVPGHGIPNGWPGAVVSVGGMTEINAENWPLKERDFHDITVLTSSTVEINDINAADFKAYTSGGFLVYHPPVDLTGYSARMSIKDRVGGTELVALTTANSKIVIDTANYTITRTLDAAATAAFTWKRGVFDMEMVSSGVTPEVTLYDGGDVFIEQEVTTT